MRQIVLDTETTGIDPKQGNRIIEIGCVELINRRISDNHYHQYIQPDRESEAGALDVHGISTEFLADKPRFADIVEDFIAYVNGAELIIHNAPFDVGFIDNELAMLDPVWGKISDHCTITDSLVMARKKHPGQKNNLDTLCKRYEVNNSKRELHGALLDAELLADVYLHMTGGQEALILGGHDERQGQAGMVSPIQRVDNSRPEIKVVRADIDDMQAHQAWLETLGEDCVWRREP